MQPAIAQFVLVEPEKPVDLVEYGAPDLLEQLVVRVWRMLEIRW